MRTVWKYPIPLSDDAGMVSTRPVIEMPHGAEIVHLDTQAGHPTLWAVVHSSYPTTPRRFVIVGTGEPVPEDAGCHVGTWQATVFVFHLFELR